MADATTNAVGDLVVGTVVVNVTDMDRAVRLWRAALGYELRDEQADPKFTTLIDPNGRGVSISLQLADAIPDEPAPVHIDLYTREQQRHVDRLIGLGASLADDWAYPEDVDFVVLRDPDGNEFCVIDHS